MNRFGLNEEELRNLFMKSFSDKDEELFCEVPVFCRSIDIVKYSTKSKKITAIEFKLNDWKKAIRQALNVGICFDYLEICIPKPKTLKAVGTIVETCKELGIGTYFYEINNTTFEHVLLPQPVNCVWDIQKSIVIQYIGGQKHE